MGKKRRQQRNKLPRVDFELVERLKLIQYECVDQESDDGLVSYRPTERFSRWLLGKRITVNSDDVD